MLKKIVVTGGPCSGKSTALPILADRLRSLGYNVITITETATDLMHSGFTPDGMNTRADFQKLNIRFMISKMSLFEQAASGLPDGDTVMLCDRGLCDCSAYMSDGEFKDRLAECGLTKVGARDGYDAVFHLESAAKCAPDAYRNDDIRHESAAESAALDYAAMRAWVGNPHWRMVSDDGTGFDSKVSALLSKVTAFLGYPEPLEIERKFLIEYPDLELIKEKYICETVDIKQLYITFPNRDRTRIRKRGHGDDSVYIMTTKRKISDTVREETETRITKEEYEEFSRYADSGRRPIVKKRTCIIANGKYFELDIFPFWNNKAILEIELDSEDEDFTIPDEFKVIREVTSDSAYTNSAMSLKIPE